MINQEHLLAANAKSANVPVGPRKSRHEAEWIATTLRNEGSKESVVGGAWNNRARVRVCHRIRCATLACPGQRDNENVVTEPVRWRWGVTDSKNPGAIQNQIVGAWEF